MIFWVREASWLVLKALCPAASKIILFLPKPGQPPADTTSAPRRP
jgi:hypothetical protein